MPMMSRPAERVISTRYLIDPIEFRQERARRAGAGLESDG